jgi:DNA-binding transcriptional MerR regulator/methylmalonyl-CoA mutase cobalamin-binding subunit
MMKSLRSGDFDIAQVERDTGLSKDTLRVWERRYGFPRPARDARGERRYNSDDVQKLRLLKRLIDGGGRPGKLIGQPLAELTRMESLSAKADGVEGGAESFADLVAMLQARDGHGLLQQLSSLLLRQGLQRFITTTLAPLNAVVGEAWARGAIATFDEHLYTEQVQTLLRTVLLNMPRRAESPRVLLTTLPQEHHALGLLMVEALLAADNIFCVSLGIQTPLPDIVSAAEAHRSDIVGLSFASSFPLRAAVGAVASLRRQLPPRIAIWIGGSLTQRMRSPPAGVRVVATLEHVPSAIANWRDTLQPGGAGTRKS